MSILFNDDPKPESAMGATIPTTWPSLKRLAGEFFRALPTANDTEAEAGFACLTLAYFGLECSDIERVQAEALLAVAIQAMGERDPEAQRAARALESLRMFVDGVPHG